MNKEQIVKQLRDMARHPTVTLPRDCEALKVASDLIEQAQKQKPVAFRTESRITKAVGYWTDRVPDYIDADSWEITPLYTSPPQRQPLTDEQRDAIARQADENDWHDYDIIDAVEAAHGITGEQK